MSTCLWETIRNLVGIFKKVNEMAVFWLKLLFPHLLIKIFVYLFPPAHAPSPLPHFPWNSCSYFSQNFDIEKLFGMPEWARVDFGGILFVALVINKFVIVWQKQFWNLWGLSYDSLATCHVQPYTIKEPGYKMCLVLALLKLNLLVLVLAEFYFASWLSLNWIPFARTNFSRPQWVASVCKKGPWRQEVLLHNLWKVFT